MNIKIIIRCVPLEFALERPTGASIKKDSRISQSHWKHKNLFRNAIERQLTSSIRNKQTTTEEE